MPFGLHSAAAKLQHLLDYIITPELDHIEFAYLDNVIVLGHTMNELIENLKLVFCKLRIKLNLAGIKLSKETIFYTNDFSNTLKN